MQKPVIYKVCKQQTTFKMKFFLVQLLLIFSHFAFSQSMIISDGTYINIKNGAKLIFENAGPNEIQKTGSIGGIFTEGESAEVIFKNVNQLGIYQVPFVSTEENTIPFTFTINTLGTGSGEIHFSTWETGDDNLPYPASVTAVNDITGLDNSSSVIDRFWSIDMIGYANRPNGEFEFTYDDNDLVGNLITESQLYAQRWNSDDLTWGDWLYSPTANPTTNRVNLFFEAPEDQYPIWTLVDQSDPLPIELVRFTNDCRTIEWVTWTETNTSHFIIEGSNAPEIESTWQLVSQVPAAGNSNQPIFYEIDNEIQYDYFRLKSYDIYGNLDVGEIVIIRNNCNETPESNLSIYPNPVRSGFSIITDNTNFSIKMYDMMGKLVLSSTYTTDQLIDISYLSTGMYIININNRQFKIAKL